MKIRWKPAAAGCEAPTPASVEVSDCWPRWRRPCHHTTVSTSRACWRARIPIPRSLVLYRGRLGRTSRLPRWPLGVVTGVESDGWIGHRWSPGSWQRWPSGRGGSSRPGPPSRTGSRL